MTPFLTLMGRVLVVLIFLLSGFTKIENFSGTAQYMASKGIPASEFFLVLAILTEVFGSLSIIAGYRSKWGAWALFLFMIPTTLIFHTNFADQNQTIHFLKNISIMGGLLYIAAAGAGPLSLDAKKQNQKN
ncbi:MAG: DoxX family protein [Nitrospiria bacterium]